MTIEKMTEDERALLRNGGAGPQTCAKALRIIDALASHLAEARAENAEMGRARDEALAVPDLWEDEANSFNAALDQVRMHVTLNHLAAFEPKTEDQATNAGRFHVALYLLKQIHAVVFPSVMVAANPEPPSDETVEEVSEVHARMTSAYRGER